MTTKLNTSNYSAPEEREVVQGFLDFVNSSVSCFHAVDAVKKVLLEKKFEQISELNDKWDEKVKPNGKYFFTRNQSTIFAFTVGGKYEPGNGFNMIGAHTDSPVLKVKPISKAGSQGFQQVGVECYGGGLWNTWFDRDLSVAGRVIVDSEDGKYKSILARINRPILNIPNLAIHLNRDIYDKGFKPNKQTHVLPILATNIKAALNKPSDNGKGKEDGEVEEHHSLLLKLLADELECRPEQIRDFELSLYDTQPSRVGGALNEFIYSARLDNLMMSYLALRSLVDAGDQSDDSQIRMCVLFDHEEVGSRSQQGAASTMLSSVLRRLNRGNDESFSIACRKSFMISADMAHAVHPNYVEKHESSHRPHIHKGLVIKSNCNQRYASNAESIFLLTETARRQKLPIQKFVVRNDMGCGSTIGPILSANCGIRTVDVGVPQFAMHSIRESCGTADVLSTYSLFKAHFESFSALDASVQTDF